MPHDVAMGMLAGGELVVVETDEERFLGTVEVLADVLVVRSGFRGHPARVAHEDVLRVTPVGEWSDNHAEEGPSSHEVEGCGQG